MFGEEYGLEFGALLKQNCMKEGKKKKKTKVELLYVYIKIK